MLFGKVTAHKSIQTGLILWHKYKSLNRNSSMPQNCGPWLKKVSLAPGWTTVAPMRDWDKWPAIMRRRGYQCSLIYFPSTNSHSRLKVSIWPALIKRVIGKEKSSSCESGRERKVSKLTDSDLKAQRCRTKATHELQNKYYLGLSLLRHGFTAVIKSFS